MKHVPLLLIWLRLAIGIFLIIFSLSPTPYFSVVAITLTSIGLLSDIFDGIIARHLGISTTQLRRLDSIIDQAFWFSIVAACYIRYPIFFHTNSVKILFLIAAEVFVYLVCYIKFKKEVATHAISSKLWTLILFATLIQVVATSTSTLLLNICVITGIITRVEILLIILIIPHWTNDVPSVYHAVLLRKGKAIKRNKIFNG